MRKFWIYRAYICYSYTGFLINCSILDIRQGSEYALISENTRVLDILRLVNISGLHKVLNKIFPDICLVVLWIWLDSEYVTILNILRLHKIVNKIFHQRYLTGLWTCLEFWMCQCHTWSRRKQTVIHVWQVSKYSLGS